MVMKPEAYKEFADLYEQEFGERISPTQARLKADKLMKLFERVIFKEGDK
jgi:hypothetical protein